MLPIAITLTNANGIEATCTGYIDEGDVTTTEMNWPADEDAETAEAVISVAGEECVRMNGDAWRAIESGGALDAVIRLAADEPFLAQYIADHADTMEHVRGDTEALLGGARSRREILVDATIERCGGDVWGACAEYPVEDWQYEVRNNDSRRGYWDWVVASAECDGLTIDQLSATEKPEADELQSSSSIVQAAPDAPAPADADNETSTEIVRYDGYFGFEGTEIAVEFEVPETASVSEKDSAMMAALAQVACIEYKKTDNNAPRMQG